MVVLQAYLDVMDMSIWPIRYDESPEGIEPLLEALQVQMRRWVPVYALLLAFVSTCCSSSQLTPSFSPQLRRAAAGDDV